MQRYSNIQKIKDRLTSIEEDFAPEKYRGGFATADLEYSKFAEYWQICQTGLNSEDPKEREMAGQFQVKIKEVQARELPLMRLDVSVTINQLVLNLAKNGERENLEVDLSGKSNEYLVILCPSIYQNRDLFIKTFQGRYSKFGFKNLFIREKQSDIGEVYRYDFDDTKPLQID